MNRRRRVKRLKTTAIQKMSFTAEHPTTFLYWACGRKLRYEWQEAEIAAGVARMRTGELILAYGCQHCGDWHIGHPPWWAISATESEKWVPYGHTRGK